MTVCPTEAELLSAVIVPFAMFPAMLTEYIIGVKVAVMTTFPIGIVKVLFSIETELPDSVLAVIVPSV